jgi:hypothetical protein
LRAAAIIQALEAVDDVQAQQVRPARLHLPARHYVACNFRRVRHASFAIAHCMGGDVMGREVSLFVVAATAMLAWASGANAQAASNPQCAAMKDKVGCACALESGGTIEPDGKRWRYRNAPVFSACMQRNSRRS